METKGVRWTIRCLAASDLSSVLEFRRRVGRIDNPIDWQRMLNWQPDGCLLAEHRGHLVGIATAIRYKPNLAYVGHMMVDPTHRRKGIGSLLLRALLTQLANHGVSRVMLDASEMGRPLYEQFGFRPLYVTNAWLGRTSATVANCPNLTAEYMPAVVSFDTPRFGADRSRVIKRLAAEFPDLARVDLDKSGRVHGYLLGYRLGELVQIGPWLHENSRGAARLLYSVLKSCGDNSISVRVPEVNVDAARILQSCDLELREPHTRMIMGGSDPCGQPQKIYAIGGLAIG